MGMLTRRQALTLMGATATSPLLSSCGLDSSDTPDRPRSGSPSSSTSLHYRSLREVATLIESRELSSVELTTLMLDRIGTIDSQLRSYATVMADQAMDAARAADAEIGNGGYRGPLHGVPIAVKDLCYTRGVRTMGGLGVLADFVPDHDATVVTRLQAAGAVILGKLNLTEGAMAGYHQDFSIPVNPWNADLWPGVSSSGSGVATAAGLCFGALGSDTGGSIRFPSAQCGLVGLKPTWGRVSRYGVLELAGSLDHVGPMTRTVADAAIMLEAISGHDPHDPTSLLEPVEPFADQLSAGLAGLRLGLDTRYVFVGVDPVVTGEIVAAAELLRSLGASLVDVTMPIAPLGEWSTICSYEAARAHSSTYPDRADEYGAYLRQFLEIGTAVTDEAYEGAMGNRDVFSAEFEAMLETVDAMICPTVNTPVPLLDGMGHDSMEDFGEALAVIAQGFTPPLGSLTQFTVPADFAGTPTISLPCGFSSTGAPLSLQLVGRDLSEGVLCRIAHAYEQATDWHTRHPNV